MLTEGPNLESPDDRTILEVRIHGVLNSPPRDMLLLDDDDIRRVNGDALGAFYTTAPEKAPRPDGDPPDILGGVRREAYSWGAMPRSAGGKFSVIGTFFVQLGWLLVAPFGLVNMAYWMREVPVVSESAESADSGKSGASGKQEGKTTWLGGRGGGGVRLFALALTLLLVVSVSVLALDVVGVQCYQPAQTVCSQLPAVFDTITSLARPARLAVLGVLPILAVLLVYLIGRRGRVRCEANVRGWVDRLDGGSQPPSRPAPAAVRSAAGDVTAEQTKAGTPPHLATENFWGSARIGPTTEYLHFAASVALVLLLLGIDLMWSRSPVCSVQPFQAICWDAAVGDSWGWLGLISAFVAAVILFLSGLTVWIARNTRDRQRERVRAWARVLLIAAVTAYVGYAGVALAWATAGAVTFAGDDAAQTQFIGLHLTPTVLIIILVAVVASAIGWMRGVPVWPSLVLGILWVGLVAASTMTWTSNQTCSQWLLVGGIAALALIAIAGWSWPHLLGSEAERLRLKGVGWGGCGAAVTLSLALFAAMTLSTMLVMGVTAYLTIPEWTVSTTEMLRGRPPAPFGSPESLIVIPAAYARFSVVVAVVLVVVAVIAGIAAVLSLTRYVEFSTPSLIAADDGDAVLIDHVAGYGTGGARILRLKPRVDADPAKGVVAETPHVKRVLATRRLTQFAHRGEPLLGVIAVVSVVVTIALMVSPLRRSIIQISPIDGHGLLAVTAPLLAVIALALIGFVFQNSLNSTERPLGLLWDIMGLLPRVGHPFGPPCYTERVVPELSARIDQWLGIETRGEDAQNAARPAMKPGNRVVLTAHSLGMPLAVAVILGNSSRDEWRGRIGLMSYGVQIRSYFGRIFPSVYGPEVLGVHPVLGPKLWSADPWTKAVQEDWERARNDHREVDDGPVHPTLREVLTRRAPGEDRPRKTAWLNLWRRTDYLGMPAYSYVDWSNRDANGMLIAPGAPDPATNPIDSGATERLADAYIWGVATHSNYLETKQFETDFLEVVTRITPVPSATEGRDAAEPGAAATQPTAAESSQTPLPRRRNRPTVNE